jgi:hypothetical protein
VSIAAWKHKSQAYTSLGQLTNIAEKLLHSVENLQIYDIDRFSLIDAS